MSPSSSCDLGMDQISFSVNLDKDLAAMIRKGDADPQWAALLKLEGLHAGYFDAAKRFQDVKRHGSDHSVDANANSAITGQKFQIKEVSEALAPFQKLLNVSEFFTHTKALYGAEETVDLFESWIRGDLYIHDPCYLLVPYCFSISVAPIVNNGILYNRQLISEPPQRPRSFIGQVAETVISLAQELAGAVAIGDLFPYYVYFLKKDGINQVRGNPKVIKEIENDFQSLVHILNASHRFSGQSAFTNVSVFDRPGLQGLFKDLYFPDGSQIDLEMVMDVQKVFCDWFAKGQRKDVLQPYPFPVVTANLKVDENKNIIDQESFEYFCKVNMDGLFNIYVSDSNKIASCCRVINNLDTHLSIFGDGAINVGSLRVVTVNLARLGHMAASSADKVAAFLELLDRQLQKTCRLLLAHRSFIEAQIERGACPFFKLHFMDLSRFFLTIDLNGLAEGLQEMGMDILDPEGLAASKVILQRVHDFADSACDKTRKILFNVEQVPGESLAYKHAKKDQLLYGMPYDIYANQFVPLARDVDVEERLRVDGQMTQYFSGGSICHVNLADRMQSEQQMQQLVKYAVGCGCEHIAINYSFNMCSSGHVTISGKASQCPMCGLGITERITRIVGYMTGVSAWSPERRDEFDTRMFS